MGYTANGDFDGHTDSETSSQNSSNVENKTPKAENKTKDADSRFKKESQQLVEQSGEQNVLNGYRSITYNFTLAGLKKEYLKEPNKLREEELELIILKSGGKGTGSLTGIGPNPDEIRKSGQEVYDKFDARVKRAAQANVDAANKNLEIVSRFNTDSPGRFDLFIDNVEIETLMSFSKDSNLSMPTKFRFDVVEPYSMNGFIEALYVTALSTGYPSYLQASFVLKIEFWGYPDGEDFPSPVKIPNSERYFPLGFVGIEVDVSEKGTRYRCEAIPYNERAFGQPNVVKKSIKMEGQTVKEILTNFFKHINDQAIQQYKEAHKDGNINQVDSYAIKFVEWDETKGWVEKPDTLISGKKLVELMKDNALYSMADPGTTTKPDAYKADTAKQPSPQDQSKQPESIKYVPNKTVVQFSEGMNIHDVITAVIRDSEYVRDILKDVKKHTDDYGMIEYFQVRIETINSDIINEETKKPVQTFVYVVSPYKIHYSKIPNLADRVINEKELKKLSRREYNYIYTGKNIDVLNFKLNFNNLFFEAVPAAMGNKDQPEAKTAATNDNNVKTQQNNTDNKTSSASQVPLHPKKVVPTPVQSYSGNASQPLDDPYSVLARNMHNAVTNSISSMLTGEIEILGDPFYLVTGGIGNYNPKPVGQGKLVGGEAAHHYQELMITINFRNPIDILPFEQGGMMYFDGNRVPFSGVYMITSVLSSFKDGVFKQRLQIIRVPGQVIEYDVKSTDISKYIGSVPDPEDAVREDSSRVSFISQRADSAALETITGRGVPSPGLPGQASNFTNAIGGLGGNDPSLQNRLFGLVGRDGGLFAGSSIVGSPLPTDISSNVRLNLSGLAKLGQTNLGNAALIAVAANVITGNIPAKRAVGAVAGALLGSAVSSAIKKSNPGSGIGEGASVSIPSAKSIPTDPTALDIKFGNTIDSSSLSPSSISYTANSLKEYGSKAVDTVVGLGKNAGEYVSDVGNKLRSLTGSPADPNAIAAQVGLDPSKISGLSSKLQSKVIDQLNSYAGNASPDTNLRQAVDQGVSLEYVPASKVQNIPPTFPYSVAPQPLVDVALATTRSLASNNPLSGLTSRVNNVDATVAADKLLSAKSQINKLTGNLNLPDAGVVSSVTEKFSSKASASPLSKLVNDLGNKLG